MATPHLREADRNPNVVGSGVLRFQSLRGHDNTGYNFRRFARFVCLKTKYGFHWCAPSKLIPSLILISRGDQVLVLKIHKIDNSGLRMCYYTEPLTLNIVDFESCNPGSATVLSVTVFEIETNASIINFMLIDQDHYDGEAWSKLKSREVTVTDTRRSM